MKAFVDTNILVDLLCERKEFETDAQLLFTMGYAGKVQLALSALSFVNAVYIARKHRFSLQEMRRSLIHIVTFAEIADFTGDAVSWALECDWSDYEDATQYRTAFLAGADCIVTRNQKDYAKSSLPVYSVAELMERTKEADGTNLSSRAEQE